MRRAKRVRYPPDLTSLFDVLFIVVFASLIRAAAVQNAAAPLTASQRSSRNCKAVTLADLFRTTGDCFRPLTWGWPYGQATAFCILCTRQPPTIMVACWWTRDFPLI